MIGLEARVRETLERQGLSSHRAHNPTVAMCRYGEIVWASPGLPELLGPAVAPTVVGKILEDLLSEWGEPVDVHDGQAYRGTDPETGIDRIVRVDCLAFSADAPDAMQLFVLSDDRHEVALRSPTHEPDHAQLDQVRKEMKQDRDDLIAFLSHELRTPLTVISGYSKLLLSGSAGPLNDEQQRYLEATRHSCDRLNHFVVDLLDACHDHGSAICLRLESLPIERSIHSVIEFFAPLFKEKNLGVEVEIAENLPMAHFDPVRIEQVLTNLIGNALKYTKVGSRVRVGACVVRGDTGTMIEVAIEDQGPGIGAADVERIFEPYVRGKTHVEEGGVGLGLAICRRILDAHRGKIGVESAPGRGSRFHFSIPTRDTGSRVGG